MAENDGGATTAAENVHLSIVCFCLFLTGNVWQKNMASTSLCDVDKSASSEVGSRPFSIFIY